MSFDVRVLKLRCSVKSIQPWVGRSGITRLYEITKNWIYALLIAQVFAMMALYVLKDSVWILSLFKISNQGVW